MRSTTPIIKRENVVFGGLDQPQPLQFVQFLRILFRQVFRLAPVLVRVVQLPHVIVKGRQWFRHVPWRAVPGDRGPTFVVDATVAEHLEILGLVSIGCLGRR